MIKKLTPIGNSLGLIIDRPILDLLNIDRESRLEITTDGKRLIIVPLRDNIRESGGKPARGLLDRFAEALK